LFRRLPKRGFKNADRVIYALVNLDVIEANFAAGDVVDETTLREKKLLGKARHAIKILANGEISKAVTVKAAKFSAAAAAKIEAAGGKVEIAE
jgi:large subunit ribosomal protein L15